MEQKSTKEYFNKRNDFSKNDIYEWKSCFLFFDNSIDPKYFYSSINHELLIATLKGEENERKRVSQDLHDALGQELNAIRLYLVALEQIDNNSTSYQEVLSDLKNMLDETIHSVRDISFNCKPPCLHHGDLGKSVEQLIDRINRIQKGKISYHISGNTKNFANESDLIYCYRIIQEFINNSLKHSYATNICVNIKNCNEELCVDLTDNGCGFSLDDFEKGSGVGNIINRLKALNAQYQFYSKPNLGTQLIFSFNGK